MAVAGVTRFYSSPRGRWRVRKWEKGETPSIVSGEELISKWNFFKKEETKYFRNLKSIYPHVTVQKYLFCQTI